MMLSTPQMIEAGVATLVQNLGGIRERTVAYGDAAQEAFTEMFRLWRGRQSVLDRGGPS
jgi:hypothetical protein